MKKWLRANMAGMLEIAKAMGLLVLVIMFINFNTKVAEQTKNTRDIVKSQNQILEAIKQQAIDNKLTSEQKTSIIICMLQVPISQRTTDILNNCRSQAESGGSGIGDTPAPNPVLEPQAQTIPSQTNTQTQQPTNQTPQPGLVQRVTDTVTETVSGLIRSIGL